MNNNIISFHEDGWVQNELDQTEIDDIEFLCKDNLQGELIPESFKVCLLR